MRLYLSKKEANLIKVALAIEMCNMTDEQKALPPLSWTESHFAISYRKAKTSQRTRVNPRFTWEFWKSVNPLP